MSRRLVRPASFAQLYNLDGHTVELTDYHWPTDTYQRILCDAGFRTVRMCQPTLKQYRGCPTAELQAEAMYPPLLLVTAEK
jgi:hypothetical protein